MAVHRQRLTHPAEAASRWSFWEKVDMLGECWIWHGARNTFGHGNVRYSGRYYGAHRCAYEFAYGPVPAGLFVCHHCDNPPCVNPAHLYAGTPADNTADMYERDRAPRIGAVGIRNAHAILTEAQVLEIRTRFAAGGITPRELAATFGVSRYAINDVIRGKTWAEVGGPVHIPDRRGRHGNHVRGANHPRSKGEAA